MKRRHVIRAALVVALVATVALAIPGSPLYLPDLATSPAEYEGRSARSWSRDLDSPDWDTRSNAIFALGTIGEPAADSVPALAAIMVDDPDNRAREAASLALSKMGPAARSVVEQLARALADEQPLVRINAARTLLRLGPDGRAAVPALIQAISAESNEVYPDQFVATVQEVITVALGRTSAGTDAGVAALIESLRTARTNGMRVAAMRALGEVGAPAAPAAPLLRDQLAGKEPALRDAAERALQQIGATGATGTPANSDAVAGLPEAERTYLWEIEHHGNVLSKYGFGRLAGALRDADRSALSRLLANDFSGTDLREPKRVRQATAFAELERVHDTGKEGIPLDREAFITRLLEYRKTFAAAAPQVKLSLMTLGPIRRGDQAGPWEGIAQLRLAGEHAPGAPAEAVLIIRFEISSPTEETLAKPGWLRRAGVMQVATARSPQPLFAEVAAKRGLDPNRWHDNWTSSPLYPNTGGVYVTDFDRDGYLDVLITDMNGNALFRGGSGGQFEDVTVGRGLPDPHRPASLTAAGWVDIDGDGWDDLLLNGRAYRNERGTRFVDFTDRSNLRVPPNAVGVVVADYDRDGRLDLYVTRAARPGVGSWLDGTSGDTAGNLLLRNTGNWQFQNVTRASGAWGGSRSTFTAAWLDANNDGWPDLHVGNEFGDGVLLVNRGNGTFSEQPLAGRPADFGTMGMATGDVNNDGHIDIYCANMYSKAGTRVLGNVPSGIFPPAVLEKMRRFVAGSQLHMNRGGLAFDQVGPQKHVAAVGWAYGACLADLDADGWLDLYATAGYVSRSRTEPDG